SVWAGSGGNDDGPGEGAAAGEASAERAAEAAVAEAMEESGAVAELAEEQSRALDEKREDITETAPVEQLLRLETDTWADPSEGWLYFEVEIARAGEEALPVLPKDVLLVLDKSWSINASKFNYFKEACVDFLKTLREGDRFNVMRYSEEAETCFSGWAPATAENLTRAGQYVRETTRGGKTDLYGSLREVLRAERTPGRPVVAVLLTDGRATAGVLENSDIISRFSRLNDGQVSVFTVGAGDNVNRFLLDMLGQFNRGGTSYREDRAQLPEAVRAVARGVARPVLANLRWRLSSGAAAEVFPEDLTHLYLDRPLRLTGRCPLEGAKGAVLQVEGESGGKRFDMVFPLEWDEAEAGGEGIRREWMAQKIYSLLHGDLESKNPATQAEIRRLSEKYRVPLP
ncbi:MAG: VWA domain-containing protein, partial [Kiritimatiellae bacterium]|nr:VWA domain-containing protein [Kiritimatiellia bacterium]